MKNILFKIFVIISMLGSGVALCCIYYNASQYLNGDGLPKWRSLNFDSDDYYSVIVDDTKYFCREVEFVAGFPMIIMMHRGEDTKIMKATRSITVEKTKK